MTIIHITKNGKIVHSLYSARQSDKGVFIEQELLVTILTARQPKIKPR